MPETITVMTFDEAEKLATANFWVESFFFANTDQGETAEDIFNRKYQITERNDAGLVHYSSMTQIYRSNPIADASADGMLFVIPLGSPWDGLGGRKHQDMEDLLKKQLIPKTR